MGMSIPYELTGRTNQKARTRTALLGAARALLAEGVSPTVEQAADRAAISRTTAYRYFANQRALLTAVFPEIAVRSLLDADSPTDPAARLDSCSSASPATCSSMSPPCAPSCACRWSHARPSRISCHFARDARSPGSRTLWRHSVGACQTPSCDASCSLSAPQPGSKRSSGSPTSPDSHAKRQPS